LVSAQSRGKKNQASDISIIFCTNLKILCRFVSLL
jgi:hypothetical protein